MSDDVRLDQWQWDRLMEVLWNTTNSTNEIRDHLLARTAKPEQEAEPAPALPSDAFRWFKRLEDAEFFAHHYRAEKDALQARAETAEARVRELEGVVRAKNTIISSTEECLKNTNEDRLSLKSRLAAIDAAREGEPPEPCIPVLKITDIETIRAWGRHYRDAAASLRVELEQVKSSAYVESILAQAREDGAREERERIFALLAAIVPNSFTSLHPFLEPPAPEVPDARA
jgi:hypothetical protein